MTPLQELQVAYERLSQLHTESSTHAIGSWSNEDDDEPMMRKEIIGSHGAVGVMYDQSHADLIVALHRTIDAQLAILGHAFVLADWHERHLTNGGMRSELHDALVLARAINGEA